MFHFLTLFQRLLYTPPLSHFPFYILYILYIVYIGKYNSAFEQMKKKEKEKCGKGSINKISESEINMAWRVKNVLGKRQKEIGSNRFNSNESLKYQIKAAIRKNRTFFNSIIANSAQILSNQNWSPFSSVFTESRLCSYFSMLPGPSYLVMDYNINLLTNLLVFIPLDLMHSGRSHLISLNLFCILFQVPPPYFMSLP